MSGHWSKRGRAQARSAGLMVLILAMTVGVSAQTRGRGNVPIPETGPQARPEVGALDKVLGANCVGSHTEYLDMWGIGSITTSDIDAGSTNVDDMWLEVGGQAVGSSYEVNCGMLGPIEVTLAVDDGDDEITRCTVTCMVVDDEPPFVDLDDHTVFLDANGLATITFNDVDDGCRDNCGFTATLSRDTFTCDDLASSPVTVTVTLTDGSGNESVGTCQIYVEDDLPPNALCQDIVLFMDIWGDPVHFEPIELDAGSTDNCTPHDELMFYTDEDTVTCEDAGSNFMLTLSVVDKGGLSSTCDSIITVVDDYEPFVFVPTTQGLWLNPSTNQVVLPNYAHIGAYWDNCTHEEDLIIRQVPPPGTKVGAGTPYPGGPIVVTLTAEDAHGNKGSGWFFVNLRETTAPELYCPEDKSIMLNADCEASLPDYTEMADASDNSGVPPVVTQNPAPGTVISGAGTSVTVTMTATDPSGNAAQCSFQVSTVDAIPPQFTCCPDNQEIPLLYEECTAQLPDYRGLAAAVDNCDANVVLTQDPAPGTPVSGSMTETVVTLTATDASGNTAECHLVVTTVDVTPPTMDCGGNRIIALDENCEAEVPDYRDSVNAMDDCGETVTVVQHPAPGQIMAGHNDSLTVMLMAFDESGNESRCTFVLTAKDQMPPVVTCPPDMELSLDDNCDLAIADYATDAPVWDNCDPDPVVVQTPPPGTVISGHLTTQVVRLTATDIYGNSSYCEFTITAVDTTPPVISDPWCHGDYGKTPSMALTRFACNDYDGYYYVPDAWDNCGWDWDIYLEGAYDPLPGDVIPFGPHYNVLVIVEDVAGHTAMCRMNVEIIGDMQPTLRPTSPASLDGEVRGPRPADGRDALVDDRGTNMYVGDNDENQQSVGIVTFDIPQIPDHAFVLSARLELTVTRHNNHPNALGQLVADLAAPTFGNPALELSDLTASPTMYNVASTSIPSDPMSAGTPVALQLVDLSRKHLPTTNRVQFRIRFSHGTNGDGSGDYLAFGTGERGAESGQCPKLVVDYYLPQCDDYDYEESGSTGPGPLEVKTIEVLPLR